MIRTVSSPHGTRLLIATGEAAASPAELPPLIRALIESSSDVLVISPALTSKLQWLASDVDRGREEADARLATVLGHIGELAPGTSTEGVVGDDTPLTAFEDAISRFRPDHILIALRASDHGAWQERNLVDRVRATFHIPITVFEIDRAGRVPDWPDAAQSPQ